MKELKSWWLRMEVAMGIRQSVEEIERMYPNEWVLLNEPVLENSRFREGELIFHSPDRVQVRMMAKELKLTHTAVLFTGPIVPPGYKVWL